MMSIEVSRHLTRRSARRAAEQHAHMLYVLGWQHRRRVQVRRVRGVRRWAVIER
jgi:hypothetical protein